MNVLVCSVGRRVNIVQYLKKELNGIGQVIAVDSSLYAPALYAADLYEAVPPFNHPLYLPTMLKICDKFNISAVFSLIDPELSVLAENKELFRKVGTEVIVSDFRVTEICLDKKATHDFLKSCSIPTIPTYTDRMEVLGALEAGVLSYPLIAKPRRGSASIGLEKIEDRDQLESMFSLNKDVVVQPFMQSKEIGVDAYVDLHSGELVSIFMKEKVSMRAGETDKSISFKDEELKKLIQQLVKSLKPRGPIDVDCFEVKGGGYVISEINPRFGGGYPHAYESGVNFFKCLIRNIGGFANALVIDEYITGNLLMKFDQTIVVQLSSLI